MSLATSKDTLFLKKLQTSYSKEGKFDKFKKLLSGKEFSIRTIEWFVTKYCSDKKISYMLNGRPFIVSLNYIQERTDAKKKRFDPFARGKKFLFSPNEELYNPIYTTIGQLNFFHWAFDCEVISYLENHIKEVLADMSLRADAIGSGTGSEPEPEVEVKGQATRRRVRLQASKTISRHNIELISSINLPA